MLEQELKLFEGVLLDSNSPYHMNLRSIIVIALPIKREHIQTYQQAIAKAFGLFEWRLETSGDILDWKGHHSSVYSFGTIEDLPPIVVARYASMYNLNNKDGPVEAYYELPAGLSLFD